MKTKVIWVVICSLFLGISSLQATGEGEGGTQNIFVIGGVGARAIGLGNAYVAMPFDATAIYWNPAGMEYIQNKSFSFFYTNLLAGAHYNFVGYVHPTINFGTIGLGAMRIGVGDIKETDNYNVPNGTFSHSESQFLLSYAKQLPFHFSAGISIKLHHWSMLEFTDTGVGADLGFLYKPDFSSVVLQNISIGLNIKNLLQPRLKPREGTDVHPMNMKFGIAKPVSINEWGSELTFFLDFEQGGGHTSFKYHLGTEYVFHDRAMLRLGMNNSQLAFGAGVAYSMFQLDYSYGKFSDHELNASHRISFSISFGKSRDELIKIAEKKRLEDIDRKVAQRVEWERSEKITQAMESGKRYLKEEDYIRAQREFNIVIGFEGEIPDALEIREAKKLLKYAEDKYKEHTEKEYAEIQARNAKERKVLEDRQYISEHFKRGITFYESEEYEKAISEWKKILERDPENNLAKEHIKKAEVDFETKVLSLMSRADALGRKGKFREAVNMLNKAINLNPDKIKVRKELDNRMNRYENKMDLYDLYQQGSIYQTRKEYKKAMEAYKRALAIEPYNKEIKKRYEDVKARAFAKVQPMTGQVRADFVKSIRLVNQGNYKEALKILESLQKIQPYNKEILDAIDTVNAHLDKQRRGR